MAAFDEIRGLTPQLAAKLKTQGVSSTVKLLESGKSEKGRHALAKELGVDSKLVLEWLNRADLARVRGIGPVYANLLEEAGVDTIKELATRVPANLHNKIVQINQAKQLTTQPPSEKMVQGWVAQAKALPKLVEY